MFVYLWHDKNKTRKKLERTPKEKKPLKVYIWLFILMCVCVCVYLWAHSLHISRLNTDVLKCCLLCTQFLCRLIWSRCLWCCPTEKLSKYYFIYCDGSLFMLMSEHYKKKKVIWLTGDIIWWTYIHFFCLGVLSKLHFFPWSVLWLDIGMLDIYIYFIYIKGSVCRIWWHSAT